MATTPRTWGPSGLVLLCIGAVGWAAAPVPPPAPEALPKWEYCEVQQQGRARLLVIRWVVGEEETEAASWQELAEKLKVPTAKKDAPDATQRVRVFNHLGSDGWELVGTHKEDRSIGGVPTNIDVWSFKRKVAK
jgi:hypothetical protein